MMRGRRQMAMFGLIVGIGAGLVAPGPAPAADPFQEIDRRFQEKQQQGADALRGLHEEYRAKRQTMEAQWTQREREIEAKWEQTKQAIERKWDQAIRSTPKVTDFGIARITASSKTQTGVVLGTPSYMSPEQLAGGKVDGRSDSFSLGVVLFELLTGEKPFQDDSIATLLFQIANQPHQSPTKIRPDLPASFQAVIDRALQKDVRVRYQRGNEMAQDLQGCLQGA
ncbi:MAG: serine/threonine protein kinase [Nitrospirota bacterium]|nr:serine/threonine protein kinase [Nitrospirota bacterium]